jgi:hypothetical protein
MDQTLLKLFIKTSLKDNKKAICSSK